jgi:hypothetical protein
VYSYLTINYQLQLAALPGAPHTSEAVQKEKALAVLASPYTSAGEPAVTDDVQQVCNTQFKLVLNAQQFMLFSCSQTAGSMHGAACICALSTSSGNVRFIFTLVYVFVMLVSRIVLTQLLSCR